jgi:hypothetical protein
VTRRYRITHSLDLYRLLGHRDDDCWVLLCIFCANDCFPLELLSCLCLQVVKVIARYYYHCRISIIKPTTSYYQYYYDYYNYHYYYDYYYIFVTIYYYYGVIILRGTYMYREREREREKLFLLML